MNKDSNQINVAIYPRKSVYRDNSESVAVQVKLCKEYASLIYREKNINYLIYDKDEGFSGKNTDRPSYSALMNDAKNGLLDVVIVYKLDRISRNVQDFSSTFSMLQEHDVAFVSVKESFDTSTPIGRTVMYILAAFAQLERENTVERVSDSMRDLASTGKWTGGRLPTGMKSIKQETGGKEHSFLLVDNDKIDLVKNLYALLLSGLSITAVERHCRNHGIKSQSGKFLNTAQIYGIITNPVYCQNSPEVFHFLSDLGCSMPDCQLFDGAHGLIGYGKTKTGKTSQFKQTKENWTIAIGRHDWVIPGEKWIAAQKRLGVNKQVRNAKYEMGLLKGILTCSCGGAMINRIYYKNEKCFAYYACSNRDRKGVGYCCAKCVKINDIDNLFMSQMQQIRLHKDFIRIHSQNIISPNCDPKKVKRELIDVAKKISNLTAILQENMESSASKYIIQQLEDLDTRHNSLMRSQMQAERAQQTVKQQDNNIEYVYEQICRLLDNFHILTYREKNELIRRIASSCVLDNNVLQINF